MKTVGFRVCCILLLMNGLAPGASSVYSGLFIPSSTEFWPLNMAINGNTNGPTVSMSTPLIDSGIQVSVDTENSTLSFDKLQYATDSITDVYSISKTAGFGVVKDFEMSVTIDPINLMIDSFASSLTLQPGVGGKYDIVGTPGGIYSGITGSPLTITGSYIISGPTETVSGTFSTPVAGNRTIYMPNLLDTSNYPSEMTATKYGAGLYRYFVSSSEGNAISRTVDGATIDWDFDYVTFRIPENTILSPGALVPEVASPAMAAFGLTFLLFARRRRP